VHLRPEKGFLGSDELRRSEVAEERARLGAPMQIEGDGNADDEDSDHLERVPEPPAQVHVGKRQSGDERSGKPDHPDDHCEVGPATGEEVRAEGAIRNEPVEDEAGDE
jgi:hypothetical protein